ncbi:hypothetical protein QTP86_002915 [Hemibagrus guttatus]|nr:hypothetical protein QTP86_002915 [Hemibagrus guttatus]
MIWRTVLHSTPLWLILSLVSGELTNEQKNWIVGLHNQLRSSVNPQAANMKRMLWDDSLSMVATSYATNCTWEHNPKISGKLGENLFMTLGPLNIDQLIHLWYKEYANYNFDYNSCVEGKLCGHYTQIVWANTSFIGCGAHYCKDVSKFDVENATIIVCNYYPPMIWKTVLHFAWFGLVLALVSSQLTERQKEEILNLHNIYRSIVKPEAADMLHMMWDTGLALVAEAYAAQCIWAHNLEVMYELGENLYITTGTLSVNKSMASWFDEQKHYDYASGTCEAGMCGHYTQVVWAKSRSVGCASHLCRTVENTEYKNATILVCNYFPPGNVVGKLPYELGVPCSKCPEMAIECIRNTCAHTETSVTEETGMDTRPTNTPWTEPLKPPILTYNPKTFQRIMDDVLP